MRSSACERVCYGESSTGVSGDRATAIQLAALMVGVWGMGPDNLPPHLSRLAVNIGECLISIAAVGGSELLGEETPAGKVLGNGRLRQAAAPGIGSALLAHRGLIDVHQKTIHPPPRARRGQGRPLC